LPGNGAAFRLTMVCGRRHDQANRDHHQDDRHEVQHARRIGEEFRKALIEYRDQLSILRWNTQPRVSYTAWSMSGKLELSSPSYSSFEHFIFSA
jgi:hypothetical protein